MLKSLRTVEQKKTEPNLLRNARIWYSNQAVGWKIRSSNPGGGRDVYLLYDVKTEYSLSTGCKAAGT